MLTDEITQNKTYSDVDDKSASEDKIEMLDRFEEAHQGMMGMLFAAYKRQGRNLQAREKSLPVSIIGGFLGSGKTTLINHLLKAPHGLKLVVLVNDFGKINIDAELIASQTDDMITLSNGCACCAVSSDLTNSLIDIAEREELPDAIVLEASGIAEPYGIVQVVLSNPAIKLDGNIVLVDAETLPELAENSLTRRLFNTQISVADLIVLSKIDLLDETQLANAGKWLTENYPDKRVIKAMNGDIPTNVLLGIATKQDFITEVPEHKHHDHHADDFESLSYQIDKPLDRKKLHLFFESMPKAVLRAKGILNLSDEPERKSIYQKVGQRWDFNVTETWGNEKAHTSLVFIGSSGLLNKSELEKKLNECLATGDVNTKNT